MLLKTLILIFLLEFIASIVFIRLEQKTNLIRIKMYLKIKIFVIL